MDACGYARLKDWRVILDLLCIKILARGEELYVFAIRDDGVKPQGDI